MQKVPSSGSPCWQSTFSENNRHLEELKSRPKISKSTEILAYGCSRPSRCQGRGLFKPHSNEGLPFTLETSVCIKKMQCGDQQSLTRHIDGFSGSDIARSSCRRSCNRYRYLRACSRYRANVWGLSQDWHLKVAASARLCGTQP